MLPDSSEWCRKCGVSVTNLTQEFSPKFLSLDELFKSVGRDVLRRFGGEYLIPDQLVQWFRGVEPIEELKVCPVIARSTEWYTSAQILQPFTAAPSEIKRTWEYKER